MNRRYFLKKIGKMAALLAVASASPGLVLSGEANTKIKEDIWPKAHGVIELREGRPVGAGGEARKGYESYMAGEYTDLKTPDADLIKMVTNAFKARCKKNGFSEMRDLTYQAVYVPNSPVESNPYFHVWGANFR